MICEACQFAFGSIGPRRDCEMLNDSELRAGCVRAASPADGLFRSRSANSNSDLCGRGRAVLGQDSLVEAMDYAAGVI